MIVHNLIYMFTQPSGDWIARAIIAFPTFAQVLSVEGFCNMLFKQEKKGFWKAFGIPIGVGLICFFILLFFAKAEITMAALILLPLCAVPLLFGLVTYGILQLKKDGVRGWDLLI